MEKNILILCCGNPLKTDEGFGYFVAKVLATMKLPYNVDFLEVGESACMVPGFIDGKDKLIVVDFFQTGDEPGTIVRLKREEVPLTINKVTDIPKLHLIETLEQITISGKCPETIFIGVVPRDITTVGIGLTSHIESKIPEVIDLILKETNQTNVDSEGR